MATMTTALVKFSQNGNSVTFTAPNHTVAAPKLLLQKRKLPASSNPNSVAETTSTIIYGTGDPVALSSRIQVQVTTRLPVGAETADADAAIALVRDFIASDEFVNAMKSQLFIS